MFTFKGGWLTRSIKVLVRVELTHTSSTQSVVNSSYADVQTASLYSVILTGGTNQTRTNNMWHYLHYSIHEQSTNHISLIKTGLDGTMYMHM